MEINKKQTAVKELSVGDFVMSLNGDKWKITNMKSCNRAGAVGDEYDNDGKFYKMTLVGPNDKSMKTVWHQEQKVLTPI